MSEILAYTSPLQPIPQHRDQRHIRGRHRVVAEFVHPRPFERLPLAGLGRALPAAAGEERHEQVEIGVAVARKRQGREAGGVGREPQFLVKFADERGLGGFTRFDLAAREFPETGHGFAGRSLGEQHAAVGVDEGDGGDEDDFHER